MKISLIWAKTQKNSEAKAYNLHIQKEDLNSYQTREQKYVQNVETVSLTIAWNCSDAFYEPKSIGQVETQGKYLRDSRPEKLILLLSL